MTLASERVEKLREACLQRNILSLRSAEGDLLWYRGFLDSEGSVLTKRAAAKAAVHKGSTPVIDEYELIVGKPCYRALSDTENRELERLKKRYRESGCSVSGQASHMAIDFEKLLTLGIEGILAEINAYLEDSPDVEKTGFYEACKIALNGVIAYADRYAAHALTLSEQSGDPERQEELRIIAAILKNVPRKPAKSFREALQSAHFVNFCLEGLYQLGRPDRYLYPYYSEDKRKGVLTDEEALLLIDCVCILFNEYVPKGLAVGFMVGGQDGDGKDVTNDLSRLFLKSIGHTRMIYPGVGLCYTPDTPQDVLRLACELLSKGYSHPAIFNDNLITGSLKSIGLPSEQACAYIHSTCVEITPVAASGVWVASDYINLEQILLDLLGIPPLSAKEHGKLTAFDSFDDLKAAYIKGLEQKISDNAMRQNTLQKERYDYGGDPLVSCFVKDCLKRGRDIDRGGALYNWIMPSFVGLANVCDSFSVIKTLVYEKKELTLAAFAEALKRNFIGQETLYAKITKIPKYGSDCDEADAFASEITAWIADAVSKHTTFRGDRFIPSLFCWIMHERFGSNTAASPDGRKSGFPLGDGSGPAQGRELKGPTASILSSTKWSHAPFIGGIAVNLKFGRSLLGEGAVDNIEALIKTYMQRGGFEVQINVVDKETLQKARENPERYRDLTVRVGGYSDYFTNLSYAMQEEVIARTAHEA